MAAPAWLGLACKSVCLLVPYNAGCALNARTAITAKRANELIRVRPTSSAPRSAKRHWRGSIATNSKTCHPARIVPRLADQGQYVASESTLYRLLREAGQMTHRRLERVPRKVSKPRALVATQADQIYCWDITYLPQQVRGAFFYLYLFVDVFSRKIVGW